MKKIGLLAVLFIIISCKNNTSIDTAEEVFVEPKLVVKNDWNSRFSRLEKTEDRDLKVEDLSNLDKINGFRNAHFNANLDDFTYSSRTVRINGYDFEEGLNNHKCSTYNSISLELGSATVYGLANGKLEIANLTFLDNKLKRINIQYVERLFKNGYGDRVNINKEENAKADYAEISLFKFYKSAFGEPTKIYIAKKEEGEILRGDFFIINTTLENAIKELDTNDYIDMKLVWETNKIYFEINITKDLGGLLSGLYKEDKYDDFVVNIYTYIKESNILQRMEDASIECKEELNNIRNKQKKNAEKEELKSL